MTDHETPFDVSATLPTAVVLTSGELLGLFGAQLDRMERNILDRLDDNSKGATERWRKHDEELAANTARVVGRFVKIEAALDAHLQVANAHFAVDHDERIERDARVKPLVGSVRWVWTQRRDIIIVLIGVGVFATFLVETFGRALGPHAP